jgi:hypothetical protein
LIRGRLGIPPEENQSLARLVREAWGEGPEAPAVDSVLGRLRPGLARVDRELEELASARPTLWSTLRGLLAPASVGGLAGAAAVGALALVLLRSEPVAPALEAGAAHPIETARAAPAQDDASPISDLHSEAPLLVFEGDDGATVIWVVEGSDDRSRRAVPASGGDA